MPNFTELIKQSDVRQKINAYDGPHKRALVAWIEQIECGQTNILSDLLLSMGHKVWSTSYQRAINVVRKTQDDNHVNEMHLAFVQAMLCYIEGLTLGDLPPPKGMKKEAFDPATSPSDFYAKPAQALQSLRPGPPQD